MSSSDDDDYSSSPPSPEPQSYNISNDCYYTAVAKTARSSNEFPSNQAVEDVNSDVPRYDSSTIRHALPAYDLWRPFFPTHLNEEKFLNFHRPKLRHFRLGPQAPSYISGRIKRFPIKSLSRSIYRFQKKLRYNVIRAINAGLSRETIIDRYLRINQAKDLTAKQGDVFLFEYCEQYPPVLSQIGMVSNVKNYTFQSSPQGNSKLTNKQKASSSQNSDQQMPNNTPTQQNSPNQTTANQSQNETGLKKSHCKIGYDVNVNSYDKTKQIYYNQIKPGQKLQVIENNMYRAPIYQHEMKSCDFLVIRTRNSFYIRSVGTIFTVGQTMPLVAVPSPGANEIAKFRVDLSTYYIHKMFLESKSLPPKLDFELLLKMFPDYNRTTIRNRLYCSGARFDPKSNNRMFQQGTSKYGLITPMELRRSFTPERYCLHMSMLAYRERLRDLNYTESMINPSDDATKENEVLAAPWNTSKAVMSLSAGRSFLDLKKHFIDPTGQRREGFSCVVWSRSPTEDQQKAELKATLKPGFTRSVVSMPAKNPLLDKIKREKLERLAIYNREAQLLYDTQSNVLNSREDLSSDDDSASEDYEDCEENLLDASFDEQLRDLDKLVIDGQTQCQLSHEKEEEERRKLLEEMNINMCSSDKTRGISGGSQTTSGETASQNINEFKGKILKIVRTYDSAEGLIQRTEIVREPKIIALYVKQRASTTQEQTMSKGCGSKSTPVARSLANRLNKTYSHSKRQVAEDGDSAEEPMAKRRKSFSLDSKELCRADGIVLHISKRVLDQRAMRQSKRNVIRAGA